MTKRNIGFVGLGSMGFAIFKRLVVTDVALHVFDISAEAMDRAADLGATRHSSPRSVADSAEVVFACLPSVAVSKEVALGSEGIHLGSRVKIYVECSTIGRRAIRDLEESLEAHGIQLIDAPVSGGPKAADKGTLAVMASGPRKSLDEVLPLLRLFGSKVFEVGPEVGMAQMMKLVNNLVSAANMTSTFEAAVLGAKAGINPATMVEILNSGTARNTATETKLPLAILTGTFDFGATIDIIYKDVTLALAEAETLGVPMWVGQNTAQLWRHAITQGGGSQDYTTLIKYMEAWAGVEVRAR